MGVVVQQHLREPQVPHRCHRIRSATTVKVHFWEEPSVASGMTDLLGGGPSCDYMSQSAVKGQKQYFEPSMEIMQETM